MIANNGWLIPAVALSAFVIGLSKGGLGGTPVTLVTPMLALVMPAPDAIGLVLPLLMIGDMFALWTYWNGWDRAVILRLLPGTIAGIAFGSILLGTLSPVAIRHIIGVFVLAFSAYKLLGQRMQQNLAQQEARTWHGPLFGGGAGVASALANAGGPLADVYLLMQHLPPARFIGTAALYFTLVNALKVPGFLLSNVLSPATFLQIAWAIPFVPAGVWVGKWMISRLDIRAFEMMILTLLAIAGVFLLIR